MTLTGTAVADSRKLAAILPDEARGYQRQGQDELYDRDTLFELINGGAEVYRALNVGTVLSRRYAKRGADDILIDIFDMGSASDAFGAYHHDMREGKKAGVGHESEQLGSTLFFWKGRFFVSIVGMTDNRETRKAVFALGKAIAAAIRQRGDKPGLVKLLPRRGLVESQVHYFHNWRLLNRHYTIAKKNLLDLDSKTEGILARYRRGAKRSDGRSSALLLVRYPSKAAAGRAHQSFVTGYLPGADDRGVARTQDTCWVGARLIGDLIVGVFDAATREQALELLSEVEKLSQR